MNNIFIGMVQTVSRRIELYNEKPTLIIFDEAHHSTANTWLKIINAIKIIKINNNLFNCFFRNIYLRIFQFTQYKITDNIITKIRSVSVWSSAEGRICEAKTER